MFRASFSMSSRLCKSQQVHAVARFAAPSRMFLSGLAGDEDTVVSRCTQKISSALKPVKISVTSTNDDPNGNHVLNDSIILVSNCCHSHFALIGHYF